MKRPLLTLMFLATFGLALAGPPVDAQLFCGEGEGASLVGVASFVDDEMHVALIDGALEACVDGVFGLVAGEAAFTVSYTLLDGQVTDVQVVFEDPAYRPTLTYAEVPAVAVAGKLGAQQNREAAFERATRARERAPEHAGGPPMDVPGDGDDGEDLEDAEESEIEPAPASRGRR